jgi:hypothetical protein
MPKPQLSVPQLLLASVKPRMPLSLVYLIKFSGIPDNPKPPTKMVDPLGI